MLFPNLWWDINVVGQLLEYSAKEALLTVIIMMRIGDCFSSDVCDSEE